MGNIDDYRTALMERVTECRRLTLIASDLDQKALLENVQEMWRALADECENLSREELRDLIRRVTILQNDILAMG